ncbi:MAG: hypothetical protein WDA59_06900 [Methanofastidiosum sp.]
MKMKELYYDLEHLLDILNKTTEKRYIIDAEIKKLRENIYKSQEKLNNILKESNSVNSSLEIITLLIKDLKECFDTNKDGLITHENPQNRMTANEKSAWESKYGNDTISK